MRLLRYDFLMWSLGGREHARDGMAIADGAGLESRVISRIEEKAMKKLRRKSGELR